MYQLSQGSAGPLFQAVAFIWDNILFFSLGLCTVFGKKYPNVDQITYFFPSLGQEGWDIILGQSISQPHPDGTNKIDIIKFQNISYF